MTTKDERRLRDVLHGMVMERQRLLIREANYLRGLVGLPTVRAEKERDEEASTTGVTGESTSERRRVPSG
jgi:hypothetical protein